MKIKARKGAIHPNWRGGKTPLNLRIRSSVQYKLWRQAIFERDNYTCQICGVRGGELEAHHLVRLADRLDLAFAIDNGKTLCIECHKQTDSYGKKPKLRLI